LARTSATLNAGAEAPNREDEMTADGKIEPLPNVCFSDLDTRHRARYRRIIRYATEAFLSSGYAGTSVEDVAIRASVSKPTIYRLFNDKFGLATAVIEDLANSLEIDCRSAINMDSPPEECLVNFAVTYIAWMNKTVGKTFHYEFMRLMIEMSSSHPDFSDAWIRAYTRAVTVPLAEYIGIRIGRGDIASGEDPSFIATQFVVSVFRSAQSIVARGTFQKDVESTKRKVRLFVRGIHP
jgi:TetR/AcrR family transcriptional repressor of mexJK operon